MSSSPFLEIWLEAQRPCRKGGGVPTMQYLTDTNQYLTNTLIV